MAITAYQKQEAVTGLKKMYSTLLNAAKYYQAATGTYITDYKTNADIDTFMKVYFEPYLNITTRCSDFIDCYQNKKPKNMTGTEMSTNNKVPYGVILNNGSFLGALTHGGSVIFYFDVNGEKGNNKSGRDIYNFYLINTSYLTNDKNCAAQLSTVKSGIYPGGAANCYVPHAYYSRDVLLGTSKHRTCNKNAALGNSGIDSGGSYNACAAVIMLDGWQIKSDYPW